MMPVADREHREALTRAGDAEERAAKAERELREVTVAAKLHSETYVDALRRGLDEQRQRAEEAELTIETWLATERAAMDEALATVEAERDALGKDLRATSTNLREHGIALHEARAVIAAALGEHSRSGDVAADARLLVCDLAAERAEVSRLLAERNAIDRDLAAAEATLRETTVALERVQREARAAEERGVRAGLEAAAEAIFESATAHQLDAVRGLDAASIAARIEAPPVEAAAAEAPDAVGDVWRDGEGRERTVRSVPIDAVDGTALVSFDGRTASSAEWWRGYGYERIRCAPAVGDAVHVDEGVEGVAAGGDVAGEGE